MGVFDPVVPSSRANVVTFNVAVDAATVVLFPVFATLTTLALTTGTGFLWINWTSATIHRGIAGVNAAFIFRFRLNGTLIAPGGGTTVNTLTNMIAPNAYTRRIAVMAGVQTVDVEWSKAGAAINTMSIDALTLPDLCHGHLLLQEL